MGKFSKAGGREMPELNTSSLPDLVFAFLFFIMMVTSMSEVTLKVEFHAPQATELQKLEKKSLVTFIYVGKPTRDLRAKMGSETRIQLNDAFAETSEIQDYIAQKEIQGQALCRRLLARCNFAGRRDARLGAPRALRPHHRGHAVLRSRPRHLPGLTAHAT